MADIELVVKIPEYTFEDIQDRYRHPNKGDGINLLEYAVANGTPLPKGHGRLIDESKITKCEQIGLVITNDNVNRCLITDAPTIIKADKEIEE